MDMGGGGAVFIRVAYVPSGSPPPQGNVSPRRKGRATHVCYHRRGYRKLKTRVTYCLVKRDEEVPWNEIYLHTFFMERMLANIGAEPVRSVQNKASPPPLGCKSVFALASRD